MKRIYLDHAATTPVHPEVIEAMHPYFGEKFGNPSSIHSFGQETRTAVEKAREQVASLINAKPEEIVFTSGGTESDNLAIFGTVKANQGKHIITSSIEHHAVFEPCHALEKQGYQVTYLPVDKYGLVDPEAVKQAITDQTVLVSIMLANNEIGTIQDIRAIGSRVLGSRKINFHTDAVQAVGGIEIDVEKLGVDLLSMSAHKFYGPKGIGALYIRKGTKIAPLQLGGSQERGLRASTENVPGIVGIGKACELAQKEMISRQKHVLSLRQRLIEDIMAKVPDVVLNGHPEKRLPNNAHLSVKYIEGESILMNLDFEGIAASTGSACSSGALEASPVLRAIGHSYELAHGSLRFTLGRATTEGDIDKLLEVFPVIVEKLRRISPLGGK